MLYDPANPKQEQEWSQELRINYSAEDPIAVSVSLFVKV